MSYVIDGGNPFKSLINVKNLHICHHFICDNRSWGTRGPIFAFTAGPPQVSAALCCCYCMCASMHEPLCHANAALSDVLPLTPLITDLYTPIRKRADTRSTGPPGEMNKCSSVEKSDKRLSDSRTEISFDHVMKTKCEDSSKRMKCSAFFFVCGDICRAGLIEKALLSHSNSIACILCKQDDK